MATRITKSLLKSRAGGALESIVLDADVRGFGVRFRPGRRTAYFFRYQLGNGRRRKIAIGFDTEFTPEAAREVARGFREAVAQGLDPAAERAKAREKPTVSELADRYDRDHARPNKKPDSRRNDKGLWRLHILPRLGAKRVDVVDAEDVMRIKNALAGQPATANQALALLSKAMNLAELWKYRPQNSNPCKFVKKFPAVKRERILQPEELTRLGAALEAHETDCPEVVTLVRVLLFTGAREDEVMKAPADRFDRRRRVLVLDDSKGGQDTLSLSDEAFVILDGIARRGSPWLIPGPYKGHPIRSPWGAWRRICETAGIEDLRIHDLRHIFGSYSHHYGASQRTVATLLRHKQLSTSERYMQGLDSEARAAANRTAGGLSAMINGISASDRGGDGRVIVRGLAGGSKTS